MINLTGVRGSLVIFHSLIVEGFVVKRYVSSKLAFSDSEQIMMCRISPGKFELLEHCRLQHFVWPNSIRRIYPCITWKEEFLPISSKCHRKNPNGRENVTSLISGLPCRMV